MPTVESGSVAAQHPLVLPALLGMLFFSLLCPPFQLRRYIFLLPILYLAYRFHQNPLDPSDPALSYSVATLWTLWLRIVALHLQSHPPESWYRPSWGEKPGDPAKFGILKKSIWIVHLFATPRHVGFVNPSSPANRKRAEKTPIRIEFIRKTLIRIPILYLVLDAVRTFVLTREYAADPSVSLFTIPMPSRLLDVLAYGTAASGSMQLYYHIGALTSVSLGIATPESWPPLFGDLSKVDSVAGFWSKFWHGMLNEIFREFWNIFRLESSPKKETEEDDKKKIIVGQRSIVAVLVAFTISASGHSLATWTSSGGLLWIGQAKFFGCQFLAICIERILNWRSSRGQNSGHVSRIGQAWMFAVIILSGVSVVDEMGRVGMNLTPAVPGSVIRPVLRLLGMWNGSV
ncbi:hypothetical protein EX30DRAFT_198578 [Ascodesmis nigricans]|uniref:Wax synthase domain-containing protein n=1 Tax=Ascodesmis nigricans TaxID=341454 RepID=A0A4V3SHT7_9PEZI|nr:hypothetical protein EX30DRAFT_198578 [Ascodesmis nigricans]